MIPSRLVKIGTLFLTDNNLVGGVRYLSKIEGLDELEFAARGSIRRAADGTPYEFLLANTGAGVAIRITLRGLYEDDLNSLRTIVNNARSAGDTVTVEITDGPTPDRSFEAIFGVPGNSKPLDHSSDFYDDLLFDATINLTVVSLN